MKISTSQNLPLVDALDMDILVRLKFFRDEKQDDFINDVNSNDETIEKPDHLLAEFLGGAGESECSEVGETEGDLIVRWHAFKQMDVQESKALLWRDKEIECASALGRDKEVIRKCKVALLLFAVCWKRTCQQCPRKMLWSGL